MATSITIENESDSPGTVDSIETVDPVPNHGRTDRFAWVGHGVLNMTDDRRATTEGIVATYRDTEAERLLEFERTDEAGTRTAALAQNREGYAMVAVRPSADENEIERYYGFDMALDHAAELLGVLPGDLPVPKAADDMGM